MSETADKNKLGFTGVVKTTVQQWGDYKEKVKWKLENKAKNRGFVLQVVKFTWDIKWVSNNIALTAKEVMGTAESWANYSELWLISANNEAPSGTLNQDHFIFESIKDTYGWMKEEGTAYFFESAETAQKLGFSVNLLCPAGQYMPSKQGVYDPGVVVKTPSIDHLVHVSWIADGTAKLVEEKPD